MAGRIVLFGATGFTGRLTAAALVSRGVSGAGLVVAGRNRERLESLADELARDGGDRPHAGHRPHAVQVDAVRRWQVAALLQPGDVLVSTVGPFLRVGFPAVEAATAAGAAYLDSTGEPPFISRVFTEFGPRAQETGARLVPAFGYDYVPGNLAAALALTDAGPQATRVDVGYFVAGGASPSSGTLASAAGTFFETGPAWRGGRLVAERPAARVRAFSVGGRHRPGMSVGGSENLALPRSFPGLRDVDVYLGWSGPWSGPWSLPLSRAAQAWSAAAHFAGRLPGVRPVTEAALRLALPGSTGGPGPCDRARARTLVVAEAYDAGGRGLARVVLDGPSPYDLTAQLLAWGAVTARDGGLHGTGALGPVEGYGLAELTAAAADMGLVVADRQIT